MAQLTKPQVPRRILGTLLSSLSAGVVPRSGAPYIAIGRNDESMHMHKRMLKNLFIFSSFLLSDKS